MPLSPKCPIAALMRNLDERAEGGDLERSGGRDGGPPIYRGEFWTAKQRTGHSLHEVSYRACFKPQLPRFFIDHLTEDGDTVLDPFAGRGTTALEAILRNRRTVTSDLNPLSQILLAPRFDPPSLKEIEQTLQDLSLNFEGELPTDLLAFFHPDTLKELCAMRAHWIARGDQLTPAEGWIRMVATNRLTGHSPGFFSVYSLPPNQAVSVQSQQKINARRGQTPPRRDVRALILRKSKTLLKDIDPLSPPLFGAEARIHRSSADRLDAVEDASIDLIVTSPPFLDVVDYAGDNWLRGWFNGLDIQKSPLWVTRDLAAWEQLMERAMNECHRVLRPGKSLAFEVGEVRKGALRLEENIVEVGRRAGLEPLLILLNEQNFTKTAHCWGVDNQSKGTNTNRIVLFRRPNLS